MSEGVRSETAFSQANESAAAAPAAAADPLAAGEATLTRFTGSKKMATDKPAKNASNRSLWLRSRKVWFGRRERELHQRLQTEGGGIHEGPLRGRQPGGKRRSGERSRCS